MAVFYALNVWKHRLWEKQGGGRELLALSIDACLCPFLFCGLEMAVQPDELEEVVT